MKRSKKLLMCAAAITIATHSNAAQNLPGRTRNLNLLPINKHMWIQFSAGQNDTGNILRDWACNCDNEDFEFNVQLTTKPHKMLVMINALGGLEKIMQNPELAAAAGSYFEKMSDQADRNIVAFIDNNLKEMLFSPDQNGKTVYNILEEKHATGEPVCVMLKELFDIYKEEIERQEEVQKDRQELEDAISKMIG
jgi:hypothetical protein